MKKLLILACCLAIGALAISLEKTQTATSGKHIGIVVPVEHQAMEDMVAGFKAQLQSSQESPVYIEVLNAQGDLGIQRAMIEKLARQHIDVIATIGTDVSLMAINQVKDTPILGMDVTSQVHQGLAKNVTGVKESAIDPSYTFIRQAFPKAKKIAMVYSASDKNYQMVKAFSQLAAKDKVQVQEVMIQSMAEMYVLAKTIESDVDAIFIAKDHQVASGAPILAQVAEELKIPFISSDEGSVIAGATLALGNKETDIGKRAGRVAERLLKGENPAEIAIEPVPEMTIFINAERFEKLPIDRARLEALSKDLSYPIEFLKEQA